MKKSASAVWELVCQRLRQRIPDETFRSWFARLAPVAVDEATCTLTLSAPNPFIRDWVVDHYLDQLLLELSAVRRPGWRCSIVVDPRINVRRALEAQPTMPAAVDAHRQVKVKPHAAGELNPRYTFDSFVVGDCNAIAHAAAQAVANNPGAAYNPLFLHASTGLGKTHLLQAVASQIRRERPQLRVAYLAAESFMVQLVSAIRNGGMDAFHARYRQETDILLIDDIHFIAGKNSTQEEFFHTFNQMHDQGKQIVMTADAYPQEIRALDERLRSRFQSGLTADIRPPDLETRQAIIRRRAEGDGLPLTDEVVDFLARSRSSLNVRELEGLLVRLEAFSSLKRQPITMELARSALKGLTEQRGGLKDPDDIIRSVCAYFRVKPTAVRGSGRAKTIAYPRQIAMYLLKKNTSLSLKEIGELFGGRDHSTVLYAIQKVETLRIEDVRVQHELDALIRRLERGETE